MRVVTIPVAAFRTEKTKIRGESHVENQSTVYFTGMGSDEVAQLSALFGDVNRRLGNQWKLAENADAASLVVIDIDTLYGHMSWLRAQSQGQRVAALTSGEDADADHVLRRPVDFDALMGILSGTSAPRVAPHVEEMPAEEPHMPAPEPEPTPEPAPVAAAPSPVEPVPASAGQPRRLFDYLTAATAPQGAAALSAPGVPALIVHFSRREYLGGNTIRPLLPHAQRDIEASEWKPLDDSRYDALKAQLGGVQPLTRLVWLAALGTNSGETPAGLGPETRFKLGKWPQIEREFPKHFRIATTMMKGFANAADIAAASGASLAEVNGFIAASLAAGHAEVEGMAPATTQKSLLERLRGGR